MYSLHTAGCVLSSTSWNPILWHAGCKQGATVYLCCTPQVPALLAVGLEGCWGLVLCGIALPLASVIKGTDGLPLDDAAAAFRAILSNPQLGLAVYSSILSIAFFNFFGVSGERGKT